MVELKLLILTNCAWPCVASWLLAGNETVLMTVLEAIGLFGLLAHLKDLISLQRVCQRYSSLNRRCQQLYLKICIFRSVQSC